ncbi:ribonuclease P protein component [Synechococcus sp. RSCCF101]|uniref:ribonuclease P protein component n=1 Tax=Synechococcus sp. RSCCF101 TaxID=2511069 RepID=UPI00124638F5|nr:ribonuclease P protein component [Synechococcus sp. RSCCF101]QEY30922.1 ribonuclease P protein component [Synechococcus sp. RSCCF101]
MALPPSLRLRGRRCFDRLYRRGRVRQGRFMTLRTVSARPSGLKGELRAAPTSAWRCAVVISGKACKGSVHRNRLRRLLHQWLSSRLIGREVQSDGRWLMLSLKPGCRDAAAADLLEECERLLLDEGVTA